MKIGMSKTLVAAMAAGFACSAMAQESVTYTGVNSNESQGNAANEIRNPTLVGGYAVGQIRVSGSLSEVNTGTFASEADIRVTAPDGTTFYTLNPFTTTGFTGTVTVDGYIFNLPAAYADAAGTWTLEFFESFNDGAGADAIWDTITIEFIPPPPPPANDNCGDAIAVGLGTVSGNTAAATTDGTASCTTSGKDVWYSFTAPYAGDFKIDTCASSGFDSVLSLFDTCGGTEIACNDDATCSFSGLRSTIQRTFADGETVLVRVAGFGSSPASGAFSLNVTAVTPPPPPPANDECAGALPISNGDAQAYSTESATSSGLTLANCGLPITINNDIFFTYTADCTGTVSISTCGTNYDTVLAVFDACGGTQIACDDDTCDGITPPGSALASQLSFSATAGSTYVIAVGSYLTSASGAGVISISCTPDTPTCEADFDGDGFVDFFDFDAYAGCFEDPNNCPPGKDADFDNDGFVDFFDFDAYVAAFEIGC